jgi:hypothetical protein
MRTTQSDFTLHNFLPNLIFVFDGTVMIARFFDNFSDARRVGSLAVNLIDSCTVSEIVVVGYFVVVNRFVVFVFGRFGGNSAVFLFTPFL